ncbi:uncharacterized protein METZ01_LOCUS479160, partial [marine metagenome]
VYVIVPGNITHSGNKHNNEVGGLWTLMGGECLLKAT